MISVASMMEEAAQRSIRTFHEAVNFQKVYIHATENAMKGNPLRLVILCSLIAGCSLTIKFAAAESGDKSEQIEMESSIYYTVKKGDTLWDISSRYFNTHWRWPQIWSENQQIMNPHRIFPGEKLRLYHQVSDALISVDSSDSRDSSFYDQPPSIEPKYYEYSSMNQIGFVKEHPVAFSGHVSLIKGDKAVKKSLLGQDEFVYVIPFENTMLQVGDVYAVYRPPMPIKDPESKNIFGESKIVFGVQYYKTGLIRIVEKRDGFAVAKIDKAFRSIMVNDILLPYEPIPAKVKLNPVTIDINGKLIKAEEDMTIIGDGSVAFINKGSNDGVLTGQTYAIYEEYSNETMCDTVDYGSLLVLHAEITTATVLILRADRGIHPPGKFRSPSPLQNR